MSSKRPVVLMAILLVLVAAVVGMPYVQGLLDSQTKAADVMAVKAVVLPAANGITNLKVSHTADGHWFVDYDYAYTGVPRNASIRVFHAVRSGDEPTQINWSLGGRSASPGTHHLKTEISNPNAYDRYTTDKVYVQMDVAPAPPFLKVSVDQHIQWPDPVKAEVAQAIAAGKPEAIVQKAVKMIDSEDRAQEKRARTLLQALVESSPRTDAAYVELARIAMKLEWNSAGLHAAETLIGSALEIQPDSVNAKILLGYVYAHQGRYKQADALFADAARANPPNLWLWTNWGESLALQGKPDGAMQKYREALARPPTHDTYDRARWDAFLRLQGFLQARHDIDGTDALLKQRVQDYPAMSCFRVDYARFLVLKRGDAAGALATVHDAAGMGCDRPSDRLLVQAMAHYSAWAQSKAPDRAESLRQARALAPVSAALFYQLASSDKGAAVARELLAAGEKIGIQDDEQLDALTYALRDSDHDATRRLLRLGASPMAEIGPQKMPEALIPVLARDFEGIRLMQRAGVDYTKLTYQGSTAIDHARAQGDTQLLQSLDGKGGKI